MKTYTGSPWQRLPPELREALAPMDRILRELGPAFGRISLGENPDGSGATLGSPRLGVADDKTALVDYLYLPGRTSGAQTVNGDVIFTGTVNLTSSSSVSDDLFSIFDFVDPTKIAQFTCAAISTATTRTFTFPDANGTLVLKDSANTFTRGLTIDNVFTSPDDVLLKLIPDASQSADILQVRNAGNSASILSVSLAGAITFDATLANAPQSNVSPTTPIVTFMRVLDIDTGFIVFFDVSGAVGADATVVIPASGGTMLTSAGTAVVGFQMRSSTSSSGASFRDQTTNSKQLRMILSGAVGNNTLTFTNTAARNFGHGDLSGNLMVVGDDAPAVASGNLGKVDLTAQVADITTTNLSSTPPAGFYEVEVILMCTTSAAGAGTLAVTIGWTDNVGATTAVPITAFALTVTGRTTGRTLLRVNSADITYAVAVTGIYSTAAYAVYVRTISLG